MVWRASAAMIGITRIVWATIIAVRREQEAQRAERAGARQQQIDRKPDHDRRQPHQRLNYPAFSLLKAYILHLLAIYL